MPRTKLCSPLNVHLKKHVVAHNYNTLGLLLAKQHNFKQVKTREYSLFIAIRKCDFLNEAVVTKPAN